MPAPSGADVLVGGRAADLRDLLASLSGTLPWMGLFVRGVMLVLLFVAFGSLVLPVKAIVMNLLSISAAFGVITWIFSEGHLSGLLGFTPTGLPRRDQPDPDAGHGLFGLSMDYEVFLLSRIREQWDRTGDNDLAVADRRTADRADHHQRRRAARGGDRGVRTQRHRVHEDARHRHARRVCSSMRPSSARMLVPATMKLLGRWNWWAPGPHGPLVGEARLPRARRPAGGPRRRDRRSARRSPDTRRRPGHLTVR